MNSEILILMVCGTGFGDQYASILSAFKTYKDLKSNGLNVKVGFLVNNPYFNSSIDLSIIWDLTAFDCEILYIKHDEIYKLKEYRIIQDGIYQVYLKGNISIPDGFKFYNYSRHGLIYQSDIELFKEQFIKNEILELSDSMVGNKKDIVGIHLRINDMEINQPIEVIFKNEFYHNQILKIEDYIKNNKTDNFMVCSNNRVAKEYFLNKFSNVFVNKFSTELIMHNVINNYKDIFSQDVYIKHSKEILAEMASFRYCKKIWSVNTFYSNFITYGIFHNKIHSDWKSKMYDLIIL